MEITYENISSQIRSNLADIKSVEFCNSTKDLVYWFLIYSKMLVHLSAPATSLTSQHQFNLSFTTTTNNNNNNNNNN